MEVKIESITIQSPTAPILGRSGERADGKATVVVSVSYPPHEFKLSFQCRAFRTLDGLAEDVRKEVETIGQELAQAAAQSLL